MSILGEMYLVWIYMADHPISVRCFLEGEPYFLIDAFVNNF